MVRTLKIVPMGFVGSCKARVHRGVNGCCSLVSRPIAFCPGLCTLLTTVAALAPALIVLGPGGAIEMPQIDVNILAMSVDGHPSTIARNIATSLTIRQPALLKNRQAVRIGDPKPQSGHFGYTDVIYYRPDGGNILEPEYLGFTRDIEMRLRGDATYWSLCWKPSRTEATARVQHGTADGKYSGQRPGGSYLADKPDECAIPDSAINFMFPSLVDDGDGGTNFVADGKGALRAPQDTVLAMVLSKQVGYFDRTVAQQSLTSAQGFSSSLLTARFQLGSPLSGYASASDRSSEQQELYTGLADAMLDLSASTAGGPVRFLFVGDAAMIQRQVFDEIGHSAVFAGVALAFILGYVWLALGSPFLAVMAALQIVLTFPATYAMYTGVLGYSQVGIMNLLSLWTITGIGVDDVFLHSELFRQAEASGGAAARHDAAGGGGARSSEAASLLLAAADELRDGDTASMPELGAAEDDLGLCCCEALYADWAASLIGCCGGSLSHGACCCGATRWARSGPLSAGVKRALARQTRLHRIVSEATADGFAAMFVTTATTAASFLSNAISRISAVRGFGLWSGMLVGFNLLLVLTLYGAALACHWRYCSCERACGRACCGLAAGVGRRCSAAVTGTPAASRPEHGSAVTGIPGRKGAELQGGWYSEPLAWCHQGIYKGRWVIVGVLLVLWIASASFAAQLQAAQEPPLLLVADSNLETIRRLLDDDLVDCGSCVMSDSGSKSAGGGSFDGDPWVIPDRQADGGAECSVFGCDPEQAAIVAESDDYAGGTGFNPTPSPTPADSSSSPSPSTSPSAAVSPSPTPSKGAPAELLPPGSLPAPPRATVESPTLVSLTWYAPAVAGGGVTGYTVQARPADDFSAAALIVLEGGSVSPLSISQAYHWLPLPAEDVSGTRAHYRLPEAVPGLSVRFRVAATGPGGAGPYTLGSAPVVMPGSPPTGVSPSPRPTASPGSSGTDDDFTNDDDGHFEPSVTPTPSASSGQTPSATSSATSSPSATPSFSTGASRSPSPSPTSTSTPSSSVDATPSNTPSPSSSPSVASSPSVTPQPSTASCQPGWFGDSCSVFCGGSARGPQLPPDPAAAQVCSAHGACVLDAPEAAAGDITSGCICNAGFGGLGCADACPACGYGSACVANATDERGLPETPSCGCFDDWDPVFIEGPDGQVNPDDPFQGYALVCAPEEPLSHQARGRKLLHPPNRALGVESGSVFCPVSVRQDSPEVRQVCSGAVRGECVTKLVGGIPTDFNCTCTAAYAGSVCEQSCPAVSGGVICSGRGLCVASSAPPIGPGGHPVIDATNASCVCESGYDGLACESAKADPYPLPAGDYSEVAIIFGTLGVEPNTLYDASSVSGSGFISAPGSAEVSLLPDTAREWSTVLDPAFDLAQPEAQQYLVDLCACLNSQPGVVLPKQPLHCWMNRFRVAALSETSPHREWPVRGSARLASMLQDWAETHDERSMFGVNANGTRVVWVRQLLRSTIDWQQPGGVIIGEDWPRWQGVMRHIEDTRPASLGSAPVQASDAWQTAFVEEEFVTGTAQACALSVAAAVLMTAVFVSSLKLAVAAGMTVGTVLVVVLAYLVISGSALGAIEAIAVVCLVGLSIDGALHFAHGYKHAPEWLVGPTHTAQCSAGEHGRMASSPGDKGEHDSGSGEGRRAVSDEALPRSMRGLTANGRRASFATQKMGWAVASAALTTAGAACFLFFTTVDILQVFGRILLVTTATSALLTLVGLNAVLSIQSCLCCTSATATTRSASLVERGAV